MTNSRVGVVTGANKGIGFATVRQLALQYPTSQTNTGGSLLIYLTARDSSRGLAALKEIQNDPKLKEAKALKEDGGLAEIKFHQLDITDEDSLKAFAKDLVSEHGNGKEGGVLDFVINNAGVADEINHDPAVVKTTLSINYYSTMSASRAFLALLKPQGRIVNVASTLGGLFFYPAALRERFLATETEDDVTAILREYQDAVDAGVETEKGFPKGGEYAVSKAGLIGASRALAWGAEKEGKEVFVNTCCPGYVCTDLNGRKGHSTPDEGAQTLVKLAIHDIGRVTGAFWRSGEQIAWKDLKFPEGFSI